MSFRSPATSTAPPDLATLKKRLHAHQKRMEAIAAEADYYEASGHKEFRELAVKCRERFCEMEKAEAFLLGEVRAAGRMNT